jgi:predicted RNA-binding Zn-ribbon protein involved in translation (DUF1610 family)
MGNPFLDALFAELDPDQHAHKCPKCGHVWEHKRSQIGRSHAAFVRAHSCEKCGDASDACTLHYDPEHPQQYERAVARLQREGRL